MATTTKKTIKNLTPESTFVLMEDGEVSDCIQASTVEYIEDHLRTMIQDEGGDSYYQNKEYYVYKLVKRVRVNIEHPLPVVKLIPVKD